MKHFMCLYRFSLKIRKNAKFLLSYIVGPAIVLLILLMLGQNPEVRSCPTKFV